MDVFNSLFKRQTDEPNAQTPAQPGSVADSKPEEPQLEQPNEQSEIEMLRVTCEELKAQYEALAQQLKKNETTTEAEIEISIEEVVEPAIEEPMQEEAPAATSAEAPIIAPIYETPPTTTPQPVDLEPLIKEMKQLREAVADMERKETIIKDLHEELQKYKSGLKKDITAPLLKTIIQIYDKFSSLNTFYMAEAEKNQAQSELLTKVLKEYHNATNSIIDAIYDYDIEPISVNQGEAYNPKKHRAVETAEVDNPVADKTVAAIKKIGFEDVVLGRVMRHVEVVVGKLKESK